MKSRKILVWFRNDLRLHDNEMLVEAVAKSDAILPVFFFDDRYFQSTTFRTLKTGARRAQFLIESVGALRQSFQKLDGDLLIISGRPEDHLLALVEQFGITEVYHHREVGIEETQISAAVEDVLWQQKINLKHFIGHTLYNKEDLPFPIKDIPNVFAQFKKKTERDAIVKACFNAPDHIEFVNNKDWGSLPSLQDLGFNGQETFESGLIRGGEYAGISHLQELLAPGSEIYQKVIKSGGDKQGFSSKLSPWLAFGCLSPRFVYWQIKDAEAVNGLNANFNQVLLGLLWRDYYRFMFKKHGVGFFQESDLMQRIDDTQHDDDASLNKWKSGTTGHVLVDKYMNELNDCGFIHQAGRLLVATFLVHILKIHWTKGAIYFEDRLVDYAPASNWGNWANIADAGLNHQSKTAFDLEKQMKLIDRENLQTSVA